jgi:DNA-binding transcriptional regulator GbsR (MarR family)
MPQLTQVERKFILHWGEMGTRWGINRTVAQVHALLYLAPRPLNAEEIAQTLSVARSNVSTSLRELESWRIVKAVHLLGDRREHYETMTDVWEMFRIIVEERKRRELDPTLELLRSCVAEVEATEAATRQRLLVMLDFFENMTACYDDVRGLPIGALQKLVKMKGKITKLLGVKTATRARTK